MLKELVNDIILRNRPEQIDITTYGRYNQKIERQATYNDEKKCYEISKINLNDKTVRSKKAFCDYIKEELKRENNETGIFATVHLHLTGGVFKLNEAISDYAIIYNRLHSEQFETLLSFKDRVLNHEEFLIMLQKLKPSIENFAETYTRFSKIRTVGRSELTSQPIFDEDGNAQTCFNCTYKIEDGTEEDVSLPANFTVKVPFVKAGEILYSFVVELLFFNTNSNQIAVKVQIPSWETIEEQAIIDEAKEIKEVLKEHKDLLVLSDF